MAAASSVLHPEHWARLDVFLVVFFGVAAGEEAAPAAWTLGVFTVITAVQIIAASEWKG
jgi:hypothetical protein